MQLAILDFLKNAILHLCIKRGFIKTVIYFILQIFVS